MKLAVWTICFACWTLLAKQALDVYRERDYRQMWGALAVGFIALLPALVLHAEDIALPARNWILGLFGAVAGGASLIYVGHVVTGQTGASGKVTLIPPIVRHELQLKPHATLFLLMNEEGRVKDNEWRVPAFILRNTSGAAIQDARITWSIDLAAVQDSVRNSPRFAGYTLVWDAPNLDIGGGKRHSRPPFRAPFDYTAAYPIPFVSAEGTEAFLPLPLFDALAYYAAATLQEETGSTLPPITLSAKLTWNLPIRGEQKFNLVARVVNGKPPNVADPEMIMFVTFEIAKV